MAVLNLKALSKLAIPQREALAKHIGCSVACINVMRHRAGKGKYGTRSDGQARIKQVNEWLKKRGKK